MRKIDYHTHTIFSPDASSTPEEHILEAINKGLDEICFTDHNDFGISEEWELDVDHYFKTLLPLKEKYKDKITVKIGVEVGLDMMEKERTEKLVSGYSFDFVIGSIHSIGKQDIALPPYFEGKTKEETHLAYFTAMKECVEAFDCFDVLGHLDYVRRYGPYENKDINYDAYQDIIDDIFKTLIKKRKGIEINLSGFKLFDEGLPNYKQVKRFYDLGGRILTMGTDSHIYSDVGLNLDKALKMYGDIGFKDVTTFTQRKKDMNLKQFDSYLLKDFELKTTKQNQKSFLLTDYNNIHIRISFIDEKQVKNAIKKLEDFIENKTYSIYLEEMIKENFLDYQKKHLIDSKRFPCIKDLDEFRNKCRLTELNIYENNEISVSYQVEKSGMSFGMSKFNVLLND